VTVVRLRVEGETHWEFAHDLPVLWPWLFDPEAITESRRLHATVFDAAERFAARREIVGGLPPFDTLLAPFAGLTPDRFPRALGHDPDAVLMLELAALESGRPYQHERASARWMEFESACRLRRREDALTLWETAVLSPLVIHGGLQRDALALAARAEAMGLGRGAHDRATALVWLLFGRPVSRAAKAQTFEWIEAMAAHPPVAFIPKRAWWKRLFGG